MAWHLPQFNCPERRNGYRNFIGIFRSYPEKNIIMVKGRVLYLISVIFLLKMVDAEAQTVRDADGNIYVTINIGKQTWMAENLKSTKLNDGVPIPQVKDVNAWKALNSPGYCYYNNDEKNRDVYGALYNWYAVNTGKLCPKGFHVASDDEWQAMIDFLGDPMKAGDRLKEKGVDHWKNFLSQATDDYDFTALPGGMRYFTGDFPLFGDGYAIWWTSTNYSEWQAINRGLHDSSSRTYKASDNKRSGFSVRCIKDQK
jgi:uncharacterized protein (TIGR02145 family)